MRQPAGCFEGIEPNRNFDKSSTRSARVELANANRTGLVPVAREILHDANNKAVCAKFLGSGPRPLTRPLKETDRFHRTDLKSVFPAEGFGALVSDCSSFAEADHRIHTPVSLAGACRNRTSAVKQHLDNHRDTFREFALLGR